MKQGLVKKKVLSFSLAFALLLQTFCCGATGVLTAKASTSDSLIGNNSVVTNLEENGKNSSQTALRNNQIMTLAANVTPTTTVSVSSYDVLKANIEQLSSGAVVEYLISAKLTATSTISVPSGASVVLTASDSNASAYTITRSQDFHGHIFNIPVGASLYVRCCIDGGCRDSSGNLRGYASDSTETSGYYGNALVLNNGTLVLDRNKSVLKNNCNPRTQTKTNGGGALNYGTLAMSAGYISGNVVSDYGGGICNEGALELTGGVIENNTTYSKVNNMVSGAGGGIYSIKSFTLPVGVVIRNNTANSGGGVYLEYDWDAATEDVALLTFDGAEVSGNVATSGGGVVISHCNMIMKSGKISGNQAGDWGGKESFGKGGGIDLSGSGETDRGVLTIIGGEISNNTVVSSYGSDGGGIYNHWGTVNMSGGLVTGNSCAGESYSTGGGIYLEERAVLNMSGGTISNNEANEGGGVAMYYYFDSYAYFSGNAIVTENTGYYGGGVLNYGCGDEGGGVFIKENAKIYNNTANEGGGVWNYGATTITGGYIYDNTAEYGGGVCNYDITTMSGGSVYGNSAYNGGGMYHEGSSDTDGKLVMTGGSVYDNTAENHGAGLYFTTNGSPITLSNCSIYNNTATKYGGGICSYRRNGLNINAGTRIYNNSGSHGGGVFTSTGLCTFNGEIKTNTASYGGGVYAGYNIDVIGGLIDDNTAKQKGGGIYTGSSAPAEITGGTISNNNSTYYGGGIYNGNIVTMSGTAKLDGNFAGQYGGGICNNGSTLYLNSGSIVNNHSDSCGGGICNYGIAYLSGVAITNNTAIVGGGIFMDENGSIEMSSGAISYNVADNYGGGVSIDTGSFILSGGEISYNSTKSYFSSGAGLNNHGTFTMTGGSINNNTAPLSSDFTDGSVAETEGGGISTANDDAIVDIQGGTIYNNVACDGGGIYAFSGIVNVSDGSFYGNTAEYRGGGLHILIATANLTGGTFYENVSPKGSGIFNSSLGTINMSEDVIVQESDTVYLGGSTYIYVPAEFNYDGLVSLINCDKKAPGRIIAKTGYGNELGTELLYYDGTQQRFELVFDTFDDGSEAFLRAGNQGAASNPDSGIANRDVFISTAYTLHFDENVTGYNVTVPDDVTKLWCEDLTDVTFGSASIASNDCSFIEWNTKADGSGDKVTSPIDYNDNADLTLYAQWQWNDYCVVTVPKVLVIDGITKQGVYAVKIKGQVFEGRKIYVSPASSAVSLICFGKDSAVANITQKNTSFATKDISEESFVTHTGTIEAHNLTAGNWKGKLSFDIYIQ